MRAIILFLSLISVQLISVHAYAAEENVATVLIKRGEISAKLPDGKEIMLNINQKLPVGAVIQTKEKSFVKLIFADKSTMNLGPSSQMMIQSFPKKEAGIIKLMSGQIRAEVTKNYMQIDDKSKSKLFIQTKSASMGIRGTDFQVNYNPENDNSTLIVFEGKVAMGNIDRSARDAALDQRKLEEIVSSSTAVMVRQGQFSAVNLNVAERPLVPTKLAPKQLDALKSNPTGLEDAAKDTSKKTRDVVPPGLDSAAFINAPAELVKAEMKDAQGFANDKTGEYKPAAGSIIDLKSAQVIEPPKGATFDVASKTFVMNDGLGKVNDKTGAFEVASGLSVKDLAPAGPRKIETSDNSNKEVASAIAKPEASRPDAPALVEDKPKKVDAPVLALDGPRNNDNNKEVTLSADESKKLKEAEGAVRKQKEEVELKAKEAEKKIKEAEEAARKQKEEAEAKIKEAEEKARKQKEEAEAKAKEAEEKARKQKEDAEKKAKDADDAAKKLKEEQDKAQREIDEAIKQQKAKDDAEKKQKEQAAANEKAKKDAEILAEQVRKKIAEDLAKAKKAVEDAAARIKEELKNKTNRENDKDGHHHHHRDGDRKKKGK